MPGEALSAQELQSPVQAVAQQTPCAQKPELQLLPAVQLVPLGARPQLIVAVLQVLGGAQAADDVQVSRQAFPAALQT